MQSESMRWKNLSQKKKYSSLLVATWTPLFLLLFVLANQAEILSAAKRAETADVEQMKKIVPFITCEIPLVIVSAS